MKIKILRIDQIFSPVALMFFHTFLPSVQLINIHLELHVIDPLEKDNCNLDKYWLKEPLFYLLLFLFFTFKPQINWLFEDEHFII